MSNISGYAANEVYLQNTCLSYVSDARSFKKVDPLSSLLSPSVELSYPPGTTGEDTSSS